MNDRSHHKTPRWAYVMALLLLVVLTYVQSHYFSNAPTEFDSAQVTQH